MSKVASWLAKDSKDNMYGRAVEFSDTLLDEEGIQGVAMLLWHDYKMSLKENDDTIELIAIVFANNNNSLQERVLKLGGKNNE